MHVSPNVYLDHCLFHQKRRSNPAMNSGGLPSGQSNNKSARTQSEEEDLNYLNVT